MKTVRNEPVAASPRPPSPRLLRLLSALAAGLALAVAAVPAPAAIIKGRVFVDRNGDGRPDPTEPGVAHVAVSDGRTVVQTSATGAYEIETSQALFVYVSLPRGYRTRGSFYASTQSPSPVDFALTEWPKSASAATRFVQISDVHVTDSPESEATFRQDLAEINALEPKPAFILATGDLADAGANPKHFETYLAGVASSKLPLFNLPGNHDAKVPDRLAHYHHYLGPDYYSFNFGNCHFVLLNGNPYAYQDRDKLITDFVASGTLPPDLDNPAVAELHWLRQDLAAAPKGATLVFGSHFMPTATMLHLFSSLGAKVVLSGHWHGHRVRESEGVLDLNSPPLRFGGIDRHPRSFRVIDIADGRISNELRLGGFERHAAIVAPTGSQQPGTGKVAVLVNAYDSRWDVAGVDCEVGGERIALHRTGVWSWAGEASLPAGASGRQALVATVRAANGETWKTEGAFVIGSAHPPLRLKWSAPTGGFIGISSPRVGRSGVVVGVDDSGGLDHCGVVAFDLDGSERWHFHTDSGIKNNVAVADGRVFATSVTGQLYALDEATGKLLWKTDLDGQHARWEVAATAVIDGVLHVGAASYVAAFDPPTGRLLWDTFVGDKTDWWPSSYNVPVVAAGKLLLPNLRYGASALDARTGKPAWKLDGSFTGFAADGHTIYAIRDGLATAMNADTGETVWTGKDKLGGNASKPLLAGDRVVIGTSDGTVRAFSTKDGTTLWSYQTGPSLTSLEPYKRGGSDVNSSPVVSGGVVYVGASDGDLHAISLADGHKIAAYSLGVPIASSPVIAGDTLYIGAYDGNLYAFALNQ